MRGPLNRGPLEVPTIEFVSSDRRQLSLITVKSGLTYVYVYVIVYVCMCIYIYIYIYIHTHTHTGLKPLRPPYAVTVRYDLRKVAGGEDEKKRTASKTSIRKKP